MEDKFFKLAEKIRSAGADIASDRIMKQINVGNTEDGTIIVESDGGYEAIYIGSPFRSGQGAKKGYMCLYTRNTGRRNSFPSTEKIAGLLERVANREKLAEGEGKAAYHDWKEFGGLERQMDYFSGVVRKMAGIDESR